MKPIEPAPIDQLEALLDKILSISQDPRVIEAADKIAELCGPHLETDQNLPCAWLNTTPSRRTMFNLLLKRRGQAVSREALLAVCVSLLEPQSKLIDAHMCHLRHALEGTPFENMIETIWGKGYRLRTEAEGPLEPIPLTGKTNGAKYYTSRIAA